MNGKGWIGVDLDCTLATWNSWADDAEIGAPIPRMVERVKGWLAEGEDVRIFTARACLPRAVEAIRAWCREHLGRELPITNVKDLQMRVLWDDRAVQVLPNTGMSLSEAYGLTPSPRESIG